MAKLVLSMLVAALAASCAGPGGSRNVSSSPFQQMLNAEHHQLASIIRYDEFVAECEKYFLFEHEKFLSENGIEVRGSGDSRYVEGYQLLAACGPDCTPSEGLGQILSGFVVDKSK